MIQIHSTKELERLNAATGWLPLSVVNSVNELFAGLREASERQEEPFSIGPEESIAVLEPGEPESELRKLGLSPPFGNVEYVEGYASSDGQYYRILLMYDNECFTHVFSMAGTQHAELEAWMEERVFAGGGDDE